MRPLMVLVFTTAIALAIASTNQTKNISDVPEDFLKGFNYGLQITGNVTDDALDKCEVTYWFAAYTTGVFFKDLFVNWDAGFDLIEDGDPSLEAYLDAWKNKCEPVAAQYENYFQGAISAYQENKEAFLATVKSNFESNEVDLIYAGIGIADLIKTGDYAYAGYNSALVLAVLLNHIQDLPPS